MNKIEEGIAANDAALNTKASVDYVNKTHYGYSGDDLLIIPEGTTTIGKNAYTGTNYKCVVIPDSVTSIDYAAFYNCTGLTSIMIPDSVTSIGSSAFENCSSLTSITIPDSVTSIGSCAFFECSSLTSITIGNGVTYISDDVFNRCLLTTIDLTAYTTQSFPPLSTYNFSGIASDCQIKVIKGRKNDLIATEGWSSYASYVVEVPTVETLDTAIAAVKNGYLPLSGGNLSGDLKTFGSITLTNDTDYEKITITCNSIVDKHYDETGLTYSDGTLQVAHSITSYNLKALTTEGTITIGENIEFTGGSHLTGISDSTGDSSTIAVSQKCLNDNYVAKSDITYSQTDLTANVSTLAPGALYFVYEN